MKLKYLRVEWQDEPITVEIIGESSVHYHVRSVDGFRLFERKIHKRSHNLFDSFDEAKANSVMVAEAAVIAARDALRMAEDRLEYLVTLTQE